ncbi:hypothetical protein McanMca71_006155 [Microsporum canis]
MEQWRERGYVPDSDEGDEFDSQELLGGGGEVTVTNDETEVGEHNSEIQHDGSEDEEEAVAEEETREEGEHTLNQSSQHTQFETEGLDTDPLQDDYQTILQAFLSPSKGSRQKPDGHDCLETAVSQVEPPSSPDALQFEEFRSQPLQTPLAKATELQDVDKKFDNSLNSSPLSSVPPLLDSPPSREKSLAPPQRDDGSDPQPRGETIQSNDGDINMADLGLLEWQNQNHRRALRQRNAIQLHPYMLENAQYRSLMRNRGVQPVRMPNDEPHSRKNVGENQSFDSQDENVPPSSSPVYFPPSSPDIYDHSGLSQSLSDRNGAIDRGIGLRALHDTNARLRSVKSNQTGSKRRKIAHPGNVRPSENPVQSKGARIQVVISGSPAKEKDELSKLYDIFDVPPSPPSSGEGSSTLPRDPTTFRFPPGFTPPKHKTLLQTPLSEKGSQAQPPETIPSDPSSVIEQDEEDVTVIPNEPTDESASDNPEKDSFIIRQIQRQIKGVLPASFARLDHEKHEQYKRQAAEKERRRVLNRERRTGKGVAQPVSRRERAENQETPTRTRNFDLFSDSESDDTRPVRSQQQNERESREQERLERHFGLFNDDDDIPEDNRIDYMAPPVSRRPRSKKKSTEKRKCQSSGIISAEPRSTWSSEPQRKLQTRITDTIGHWRKSKPTEPRPPKLGILDAEDVSGQRVHTQPQFLRIAARQARSRRDKGRRSPSHKVLKLATKADTHDANASLRNWRAGKYKPAPSTSSARTRGIPKSQSRAWPSSTVSGTAGVARDPTRRTGLIPEAESEPIVIDDDGSSTEQPTRTNPNKKRQKLKNNWVIQHPYGISSFQRHVPRPAQLDVEDISTDLPQRPSTFHGTLSALRKAYKTSGRPLTLTRFLSETQKPQPPQPAIDNTVISENEPDHSSTKKEIKKRRITKRKRQPKHINIETFEYRQPPDFDNGIGDTASIVGLEDDDTMLPGLHRPERPYKLDFDTHPLYIGTYYHQSTFIGSGKFSQSLHILSRDLDIDNGHSTIRHGDKVYSWGSWNETVSSELGDSFVFLASSNSPQQTIDGMTTVPTSITTQVLELYQSIICYISEHLSFIDPVDRSNLVSRCTGFVSQLTETHLSSLDPEANVTTLMAGIEMFNLVFLNQLLQISKHETVDSSRVGPIVDLMRISAQRTMDFTLTQAGIRSIQQFLEDNRKLEKRETGIRDDYPFVDAFVIAQIILQQTHVKDMGVEVRFLDRAMALSHNVQGLERIWEALFISLPFQEIDEFGIFHTGLRFQLHNDHWPTVKQLTANVLESYRSRPKEQWASLNNYMRTLLHRCFILIKNWGWQHCKPILEMFFDFFTGNSLHDLEKEPVHGSPRFLDQLDSDPVLEIEATDTCFRLFLKIITVGLRYLSSLLEPKKVLNLVWRLLPNHGRTYPKEKPLRVEDLNALRNHHDLLCALYCCAPKGCRPHLNTIQRLVHPPTSHKDACSINIHSWSRLVRFTLAKDKDASDLGKFAEWHGDFIIEILRQHSQARSEIEAEVPAATFFPRQYIEGAIVKNERHAEALISDALVCMKSAIDATKNMDQAALLMEKMPLGKIFGLFNPKVKRRDAVICQVLDVVNSFTKSDNSPTASVSLEEQVEPSETNEDSQDDWLDLCQEQLEVSSAGSSYLNRSIAPALSQFVSTCFGVDQTPDDSILIKIINTWLAVAHTRVKHGMRQWSSYFNRYDQDSWPALKSTDQTRRFMPYFLSRLILSDPASYEECRSHILTYWSASLVERELFLKYQHELTNALLNEDYNNPLFRNLPFAVNRTTGKYEITLSDFCQRRVSLVSCVLSNMRLHISDLSPSQIYAPNGFGEMYQEMIRAMMATMRQNSEEVGKTVVPGSYVDFVHRVVEFLQVHAEDICPVDKYFMDPASFPLPASDPNYVVAKLKRYAGRISGGSKFAKQLVTFIQGVSERAAIDAQQSYLAGQFYEAMSGAPDIGGYQRPTLRCFLLQCVIPEYVAASLNHPTAWILARPLIQATTRVFSDLMLTVDCTKQDEVDINISSIAEYFKAAHTALQCLIDDPGLLQDASVLLTLTSIFESIIASLAIVDYLDRLGQGVTHLLSYIEFFGQTALFSLSSLLDPPAITRPYLRNDKPDSLGSQAIKPPAFFTESRSFAARELESWLEDNWALHDGKYFVRRGQQYAKIDINPGILSVEVAKTAFIQTIRLLFGSIETLGLL